jgi:EpsI family protein
MLVERIADAPVPGDIAIDRVDGWRSDAQPFTTFAPHYLNARSKLRRTFASGDRPVDLFVAYYNGQLHNGSLITYDNDVVLVTDKVWGSVGQRAATVRVGDRDLSVVENEIKGDSERGHERLLTWSWYWINGRVTTSKYVAKAWTAIDKLLGRGDDSAVIVLTTPIRDQSIPDARRALESFAAAVEPQVESRLAAVHDQARK